MPLESPLENSPLRKGALRGSCRGVGGDSAVQPQSTGGVRGRRGDTHTHTHTHTQEHTHTHTQEHTHTHTEEHRNVHANVAPTL